MVLIGVVMIYVFVFIFMERIYIINIGFLSVFNISEVKRDLVIVFLFLGFIIKLFMFFIIVIIRFLRRKIFWY